MKKRTNNGSNFVVKAHPSGAVLDCRRGAPELLTLSVVFVFTQDGVVALIVAYKLIGVVALIISYTLVGTGISAR